MTYDPIKNNVIVAVSGLYNASAVTITLTSGERAKLLDPATHGEYNLGWFNITDYASPHEDPYVEYVRVKSFSATPDVITVQRPNSSNNYNDEGAENVPTTKNVTGKEYAMGMFVTKKILQDIIDDKADLVSPSFTTPNLGEATATSINGVDVSSSINGFDIEKAGESKLSVVEGEVVIQGGGSYTYEFPEKNGTVAMLDDIGGTGISWEEAGTPTKQMEVNKGYVPTSSNQVVFTLPELAAIGNVVRISGYGEGGWKVLQHNAVEIFLGDTATTEGTSGYLESTQRRDSIELVCVQTNLKWNVVSSIGNIRIN